VPAIASSDAPPAPAPDVQHAAAPAAAVPAAFTPPPASFGDNAVPLAAAPMVAAPAPVSGVVSDSGPLPAMPVGGSTVSDSGAFSTDLSHYASYGWYIVPSIGNDPTYADVSTGDGDSEWGFADAGYASDWFFFA
jgi:hypothetical protein